MVMKVKVIIAMLSFFEELAIERLSLLSFRLMRLSCWLITLYSFMIGQSDIGSSVEKGLTHNTKLRLRSFLQYSEEPLNLLKRAGNEHDGLPQLC